MLALELLYENVLARFAAELEVGATAIEQPFGWRSPARRTGAQRIVWVPGDDGDVGAVTGAIKPGRNPRPLWTIGELCTVYVEAYDRASAENDLAQYRATRLLLDQFLRAVHHAAPGRVDVGRARWVDDKNERRAGAAIRLVIEVEAMVPDVELETTTAASSIEVEELDATEIVESSLEEEEP